MSEWRAEFTKLRAWQLAVELAAEIFELTSGFPTRELYGMSQQLRRAAVSMSSNVAEGYARLHPRDKARFYEIARSSGEEVKSLLFLSLRLKFLEMDRFESLMKRADETCRVIYGLMEATHPSR